MGNEQQKLSAYDRLVYRNLMQKEAALDKTAVNWTRVGARIGGVMEAAKRAGKSIADSAKFGYSDLGTWLNSDRLPKGKIDTLWLRLRSAGKEIANNENVVKGRQAVGDYAKAHQNRLAFAGGIGVGVTGATIAANNQQKTASYRVLEKLASGNADFIMKMAACGARKKGKTSSVCKRKIGC